MLRSKIEESQNKEEHPIYLVIFSTNNGRCLYKRAFSKISFDDGDLITSFISAINLYGKKAFSSSGSIDRIKHGDYLIIFQSIEAFSFGYVFKGQSYSAISKLDDFIETVSTLTNLLENLSFAEKSFTEISKDTRLTIDQLVEHIFLLEKKYN